MHHNVNLSFQLFSLNRSSFTCISKNFHHHLPYHQFTYLIIVSWQDLVTEPN